jgi:hypothetical protein
MLLRHPRIAVLVLLAVLAAGCAPAKSGIASGGPLPGASPTGPGERSVPAAAATELVRVPLPSGFPVLPGAVAVAMRDDDSGLIGLWESDQLGSSAYDYYVAALPEAGYPIVGLYPGGDVALIRFGAPGGGIWQLVVYGAPDGLMAIEVRLDRP